MTYEMTPDHSRSILQSLLNSRLFHSSYSNS